MIKSILIILLSGFLMPIKFLNEPHLLAGGFVLDNNLFRHIAFHVYSSIQNYRFPLMYILLKCKPSATSILCG